MPKVVLQLRLRHKVWSSRSHTRELGSGARGAGGSLPGWVLRVHSGCSQCTDSVGLARCWLTSPTWSPCCSRCRGSSSCRGLVCSRSHLELAGQSSTRSQAR